MVYQDDRVFGSETEVVGDETIIIDDLPPGRFTSLAFDLTLFAHGGWSYQRASFYIEVRHADEPAGVWHTVLNAKKWQSGLVEVPDLRTPLGASFAGSAPKELQIRMRCLDKNRGHICTLRNLRLLEDIPGWTIAPDPQTSPTNTLFNQAYHPFARLHVAVTDAPYTSRNDPDSGVTLPPPGTDNPYLVFESFPVSDWTTPVLAYRGPVVRLPAFDASAPVSLQLQWAQESIIVHDDPAHSGWIAFDPLDTPGDTDILTLPAVETAPWESLSADLPTSLSGKTGQVVVVIHPGRDTITGIDDISFAQGGQPLALPIVEQDTLQPDARLGTGDCSILLPTSNLHGAPVNTLTGAFVLSATDLHLPTAGLPLHASRSYGSLFADTTTYPGTTLGPGWRHAYDERLTLPQQPGGEPDTLIYEMASGNRVRFFDTGVGYAPAPGVRATLEAQADGSFVLHTTTGEERHIDSQGRLVLLQSASGHTLRLTYDADGQLATVTDDTSGRALVFAYQTVTGEPRVSSQ